jgi:ariadne-1
MGPWSEHGTSWYNCNRFNEKDDTGKDAQSKSRMALERYLHVSLDLDPYWRRWSIMSFLAQYYNRYANHEQSSKLEKDLYLKIEKKMEEIQISSNLSWIEVQFMKRAVDTLSDCRTTLKWTYAMAYYLKKNEKIHHTELFEDNQRWVILTRSGFEKVIDLLSIQWFGTSSGTTFWTVGETYWTWKYRTTEARHHWQDRESSPSCVTSNIEYS